MISIRKLLHNFLNPYIYKRRRTVRYAFPALAIFGVLLLGAAVINSDDASSISMEISDSTVQAGQPISLTVFVDAHTPVNAVDLVIEVPSEYLEVKSIDTGESVITLWTVKPYFKRGKVYLQGGTYRKGFVSKHKIAVINAVAKETGIADINVSNVQLLAGDGSGSSVDIDDVSETLSILIADSDSLLTEGTGIEGTISIAIVTDIDGDGEVTLRDVSRFMSAWSNKSIIYDFNNDMKMTFIDFGIILADSFLR